jgi:hypothetical protein
MAWYAASIAQNLVVVSRGEVIQITVQRACNLLQGAASGLPPTWHSRSTRHQAAEGRACEHVASARKVRRRHGTLQTSAANAHCS